MGRSVPSWPLGLPAVGVSFHPEAFHPEALTPELEVGELLRLYRQRYDVRDAGHVLYALSYFDDAEREPMPLMLWSEGWPEIRGALEGWVREVAQAG